jgi:MFS family permease
VQAAPAAVFFALLFLIPESPRWLAKQGRTDEARRVLARVGEGDADRELADITASLAGGVEGAGAHAHGRLFQRRYARPITLAVVIAVLNQVSGINAIIYYAPRIFQQAGAGADAALRQSVAVGGTNLVFTVLALFIIDRFGRRVTVAGLVMVTMGLAAIAVVVPLTSPDHQELWLLVPLLVAGLGSGATISPNIAMTLASVPPAQGGAAGGALQTGQRIGSAVGAAVLAAAFRLPLASGHAVGSAVSLAFGCAVAFCLLALVMAVRELRLRPTLGAAAPTGREVQHTHG